MLRWILHRLKGDKIIWILIILISLVSILAVYSASSALAFRLHGGNTEYSVIKHAILLGVGFLIIFIVHLMDYRIFARLTNILLTITIPLLLYTIVSGSEINEAARWISLFGQSFQPSDLAKLTLMIYLAKLLTQRQDVIKDFYEGFLPSLFWVSVICGLIAPSNLSTAILMFMASMMVMFIGGVDLKYLGMLVSVAIIGLLILVLTAKRSETWQSRWSDYAERITNEYYEGNVQTTQSNVAIASGGIFGRGVGKSAQRNFIPLAHADFVYAIIIEEYGLLGGVLVLGLYLMLLFRSVIIVTVSKTFGALMAAGLSFILVLQAMLNMSVTVGLLPVTGLTLPLISMGGTSILITSVSLGIILSVSRDAMQADGKKSVKKPGFLKNIKPQGTVKLRPARQA
ncbi:MAG: FtsW/RodA/SpoVE family cell cycle protein [Bacteroidia bacterium]|nr:FtsW/RodA/SpoVE family cell cycle protein [Bacteroidia bacterium]